MRINENRVCDREIKDTVSSTEFYNHVVYFILMHRR